MALIPLREKVNELSKVYYAVQRQISQELLRIDVGNYQEMKAMKVQERTTALVRRLNREAKAWANSALPEAYKQSYRTSRARLDILGFRKVPDFYEGRHGQTIEEYIDKTMDYLLKANMSINQSVAMYIYLTRQAAKGLAQIQAFDEGDEIAIEEIIGDAIKRGEKPGYAMKIIRGYFAEKVVGGQMIKVGNRHYTLRYYSRMVARTMMRKAQSEAVRLTCEQHENDLVKVSEHGTKCEICAPYEGNVYSLSGQNSTYPMLDEDPPWHPNCKHNILPTSEEAIAVTEGRRA